MMNLLSSISAMPTQVIPLEVPIGPLMIAAFAVVVALAVADQARARLFPRRPARTDLRVAHSH